MLLKQGPRMLTNTKLKDFLDVVFTKMKKFMTMMANSGFLGPFALAYMQCKRATNNEFWTFLFSRKRSMKLRRKRLMFFVKE